MVTVVVAMFLGIPMHDLPMFMKHFRVANRNGQIVEKPIKQSFLGPLPLHNLMYVYEVTNMRRFQCLTEASSFWL